MCCLTERYKTYTQGTVRPKGPWDQGLLLCCSLKLHHAPHEAFEGPRNPEPIHKCCYQTNVVSCSGVCKIYELTGMQTQKVKSIKGQFYFACKQILLTTNYLTINTIRFLHTLLPLPWSKLLLIKSFLLLLLLFPLTSSLHFYADFVIFL